MLRTVRAFAFIAIYFQVKGAHSSKEEEMLQEKLFKNYNPLMRPVSNDEDQFKVDFGIGLHQIISVMEKEQIMKVNIFLEYHWYDKSMQWDPEEYAGISKMSIAHEMIWHPDVVLLNNADGQYEVTYKPNVVVSSTGSVIWIPISIYKCRCSVDVKYFPYDQQECELRFGSWTYDAKQLDFGYYQDQTAIDLKEYLPSGSWDIVRCPGGLVYSENNTKVEFIFKIYMRRKSLFYTINLLIPVIITGFLSIIIFYLPADAGEKIIMCISVLLSINVFIVLIGKLLPPTSTAIPLISRYIIFTLFMNILTIFLTIIIINVNYRMGDTYKIPRWFRRFFLQVLPKLLFIQENNTDRNAYESSDDVQRKPSIFMSSTDQLHSKSYEKKPKYSSRKVNTRLSEYKTASPTNYIAMQMDIESDYKFVRDEWRLAATVIDRMLFCTMLTAFVIGTLSILLSSPYIFGSAKTNSQQ